MPNVKTKRFRALRQINNFMIIIIIISIRNNANSFCGINVEHCDGAYLYLTPNAIQIKRSTAGKTTAQTKIYISVENE